MTRRYALALALVGLVASPRAAGAHHSFSAVYDGSRTVTVEGVVSEFRLINPHALMTVHVTDDSGKVVDWVVEFAGRLNLTEGGWNERTVVPGQRVTVTGNPTHKPSARMAFVPLMRADGTTLLQPGAERQNAIDAQRRLRAKERDQAK
jgi:hypothetical protein